MARFDDLLEVIPKGSFYDSTGHVLPHLDRPHEFVFQTDAPTTAFGVFVDEIFQGTITTDLTGQALVAVKLAPGRHDIVIENDITGRRFSAYVTIRDYATWLASYADTLEGTDTFLGIDAAIESVDGANKLALADTRHIEDSQGRILRQPNDFGSDTEAYRHALRRIRQAYRIYSGKLSGLRQVVNAITSVSPLRLKKHWLAQWILENQLVPNYDGQQRSRAMLDPLLLINGTARSAVTFINDNQLAATTVTDPPTAQLLQVTFSPSIFSILYGGTGGTLTGPVGPTMTFIADTPVFTPADVGRYLVIVGAPTAANNGAWLVTSFTSGTTIGFTNASGVAETARFAQFGISQLWAGGSLTINGTALGGDVASEVITAVPGATVLSTITWETITSITNSAAGAGNGQALVGLTSTQFIEVLSIEGNDPLNTPLPLSYNVLFGRLSWAGGPQLDLPYDGVYTLPSRRRRPEFMSLAQVPGGGWNLTSGGLATNNYLWLSSGGLPKVRAPLTTNLGAADHEDVAADVNTAVRAMAAYSGPTGTIDQFNAVISGRQRIIRATGASWTTDLIGQWVEITGSTNPANNGFREVIDVIDGSTLEVLTTVGAATAAGEAAPYDFRVMAVPVTGVGLAGDTLLLVGNYGGPLKVYPDGADASNTILGIPRYRATLTAPTALEGTTLSYSASRLPVHAAPWSARVGRGLAFTGGAGASWSAITGEFTALAAMFTPLRAYVVAQAQSVLSSVLGVTLPTPQAVVAEFDSAWTGGNVTITGTAPGGSAQTEILTAVPGARVFGSLPFATITGVSHPTIGGPAIFVYVGLDKTPAYGSYVRIQGTASANDGLHRIVGVVNGTTVLLQHETSAVYPGGLIGTAWQWWVPGEVVSVLENDTGASTLTLAEPGTLFVTTATNPLIEVAGELPLDAPAYSPGSLVVRVDRSQLPLADAVDYVQLQGNTLPDYWSVQNATAHSADTAWLQPSRVVLTATGTGDASVSIDVPRAVSQFRGFPLRVNAWVQQHNTASQSFRLEANYGTGFVTLSTTLVSGTLATNNSTHAELDPTLISATLVLPVTATTLTIRIVHIGSLVGERIGVERIAITSAVGNTSLYLEHNTVPYNAQQDFTEILYIWSPDDLDPTTAPTVQAAAERTATIETLGLPPTTMTVYPEEPGHIDYVMPAHMLIQRTDLSQYDGFGDIINVVGAYDDATWNVATLTNMDVDPMIPGRLSDVIPTRVSRIVGELLAPDIFGNATLANSSVHSGPYAQNPNGSARLYRNGIPIPDTDGGTIIQPWTFTAANAINIDASEFSPAATYTIDYDVLIRAETAVLDLGINFQDYLWFFDAALYQRTDTTYASRTVTQEILFQADLTGALTIPSDEDQTQAVLRRDDGITREQVNEADWSYVDANTIQITGGAFDSASIYTLEYTTVDNLFHRQGSVLFEVRQNTTIGTVTSATYAPIQLDELIDNTQRYLQIRATFSSVVDVRDIRLGSLVVRGVQYQGVGAFAPGIGV